MAHLYAVQTSDGCSYEVSTQNHPSDQNEKTFAQHLLGVIKQSVAQIVAGIVVHRFTYKGPR